MQPLTLRIDRIPAGSNHHIALPDARLDAVLLSGFTEASRLEFDGSVEAASGERARQAEELRLLPPSHWGGGRSAPELLAAFVRPNDPAVDVVLRDAATKLGEAMHETSLNGRRIVGGLGVVSLLAMLPTCAGRPTSVLLPVAESRQLRGTSQRNFENNSNIK